MKKNSEFLSGYDNVILNKKEEFLKGIEALKIYHQTL